MPMAPFTSLPPGFPGGFFERRYGMKAMQRTAWCGATALAFTFLSACAGKPELAYPAFRQSAELPDLFVSGLPGVRGKRFSSNPTTRRSGNLLTLPPDWSFTTGGFPDKSVEIYVLAGELLLDDLTLVPGSYAFVPAASPGLSISTEAGAQVLYFLDEADAASVIQTPLITRQDLVAWSPAAYADEVGIAVKALREDPGSGAKTWLLRVEPGASLPWLESSVVEEGFLLEGHYRHAECVDGISVEGEYQPGGFFTRPANTVNGGPASAALQPSIWYMRRLAAGETEVVAACEPGSVPVEASP